MWSDAVVTIIVLPPMLPQPVLGFYLPVLLGPAGSGGLLASLWGERSLPSPSQGSLSDRF